MNRGRFAGSWSGSGQVGPFSSKPYTHAELEELAALHLAALHKYGAGHRVTEAHRESLQRAVASYSATHKKPATRRPT